MSRRQVLAFTGCYLPGYKGGGPVRTIASMVDQLRDELDFRVVTLDRDVGDVRPYPEIPSGVWTPVGMAQVLYLPPGGLTFTTLRAVLADAHCDVLYLNSFFSPSFSIKPLLLRKLGLIPRTPAVVAPRGEFSAGAMAIKQWKKLSYLYTARTTGLYQDVIWQASSNHEERDIRHHFGTGVPVIIAPNLRPSTSTEPVQSVKSPGRLRMVFLSRISRKKNLDGALKLIGRLGGDIGFDIYGPIEDEGYWEGCLSLIKQLPSNITVRYCGPVEHEQVGSVLASYDLFFFPTHGENFGHVILESFLAGTPVLISDQTPWRGLQREGVGWDLPLSEPAQFEHVLQRITRMEPVEHASWSANARRYGVESIQDTQIIEQNLTLFRVASGQKAARGDSK